MVNFQYKDFYGVEDLRKLIAYLRSEDGCPWDREQTHESIRRNFLEETYEACEAIDNANPEHLKEELGDVLTQIIFHADIEEDMGRFNLDQVADAECKKLISRHPHVFGDTVVDGTENVLSNWDQIKRREKKQETTASAMDSVAKSLPSTWRAEKIQSKAKKVGFDWDHISGAVDKLSEELEELKEALLPVGGGGGGSGGGDVEVSGSQSQGGDGSVCGGVAEEVGDVLFSAVNVARMAGIDPEDALHAACDKFAARFRFMEEEAARQGRQLEDMTLDQQEALYQMGKRKL